jgi:hypothetical protein
MRGVVLPEFLNNAKTKLRRNEVLIEFFPGNSLLELAEGGRGGTHVVQETAGVKLSSAMSFSVGGTSEMI